VIIAVLLYPSTQCQVSKTEITPSEVRAFAIPVREGYAVGFTFNVTNGGTCDISAQQIRVVLKEVVYADGRQATSNVEETESILGTLNPGQTGTFSHTFDSYFEYRPTRLVLTIEIAFAETGSILVLDGELTVPPAR